LEISLRAAAGKYREKFFDFFCDRGLLRKKQKNYNSMTRLMPQGFALSSFFLTREPA